MSITDGQPQEIALLLETRGDVQTANQVVRVLRVEIAPRTMRTWPMGFISRVHCEPVCFEFFAGTYSVACFGYNLDALELWFSLGVLFTIKCRPLAPGEVVETVEFDAMNPKGWALPRITSIEVRETKPAAKKPAPFPSGPQQGDDEEPPPYVPPAFVPPPPPPVDPVTGIPQIFGPR